MGWRCRQLFGKDDLDNNSANLVVEINIAEEAVFETS
jgi:hypothetical protein